MNDDPVYLSDRAKVILGDPLVQHALSEMKSAVLENWSTISVDNVEQQLRLKHLMWATQQFEKFFTILIEGGEISLAEAKAKSAIQSIKDAVLERVRTI